MSGDSAQMEVVVEDEDEERSSHDHETEAVSPQPLHLSWPPSSPALAILT